VHVEQKTHTRVFLEKDDYNAVHITSGMYKSNTYWPEAVTVQTAQHGFLPAVTWRSLGQREVPRCVAGSHCFPRSGNPKAGDKKKENSAFRVTFLK